MSRTRHPLAQRARRRADPRAPEGALRDESLTLDMSGCACTTVRGSPSRAALRPRVSLGRAPRRAPAPAWFDDENGRVRRELPNIGWLDRRTQSSQARCPISRAFSPLGALGNARFLRHLCGSAWPLEVTNTRERELARVPADIPCAHGSSGLTVRGISSTFTALRFACSGYTPTEAGISVTLWGD